ncbi:MAG TPA: SDR family oxidoreductase [Casimicrobiaceae bacterium]
MTFRDDLFVGKVALVIGGTGGIGAAIGDTFAALGAVVTVTGATDDEVNAVRNGPDFRCRSAVVLDVRDSHSITALIGDLPRLDILVNCAGVIRRDVEHEADVFADVVDINLNGTMRCCSAARERLKSAHGAIVNTASMLAFHGGARVPAYSASKGGVAQLTKSLAIAYASDGIRVNAVAPGWVRTSLTQALQNDSERSSTILARTPQGRWAEPADIAGAVVFLCSPAARFVTGVVLPVDGGYLAM